MKTDKEKQGISFTSREEGGKLPSPFLHFLLSCQDRPRPNPVGGPLMGRPGKCSPGYGKGFRRGGPVSSGPEQSQKGQYRCKAQDPYAGHLASLLP